MVSAGLVARTGDEGVRSEKLAAFAPAEDDRFWRCCAM